MERPAGRQGTRRNSGWRASASSCWNAAAFKGDENPLDAWTLTSAPGQFRIVVGHSMPRNAETYTLTRNGAWLTALYKAFAGYDQTGPAFDAYEATILAAKAGVLLSSIRSIQNADGQQYVDGQQFNVYRRLARLTNRETQTVLQELQKLGIVSVQTRSVDGKPVIHSVETMASSRSAVFKAVGSFLNH